MRPSRARPPTGVLLLFPSGEAPPPPPPSSEPRAVVAASPPPPPPLPLEETQRLAKLAMDALTAGPPALPPDEEPAARRPLALPSLIAARAAVAAAKVRAPVVLDETLLDAEARAVALRLEQLFTPDGRSWLEVHAAAARIEGARVEDVIAVRGKAPRSVACARRRAWCVIFLTSAASYPDLARALGRPDHTTIMRAVQQAIAEGLGANAADSATPDAPPPLPDLSSLPPKSRAEARARVLAARRLPDGRSWLEVVAEAAAVAGASLEDALSGSPHQAAARARHLAWHELHRCASYSYGEIARVWGAHQGTIAAAVKAIAAEITASRSVP